VRAALTEATGGEGGADRAEAAALLATCGGVFDLVSPPG
jgi:hypothetical protein